MRVILLGRKPWACGALHELLRRGHQVVGVVAPDSADPARERAMGGPSLREAAAELGLRVVDDRELYAEIEAGAASASGGLQVELVISFLYPKRILPPLIRLPSLGCFNFHPAPLPEFRGRRGYNSAILEGCETYGVSVHWVNEKFDEGNLVKVVRFSISREETALSLEKKTMAALLDLFAEFLDLVGSGAPIPSTPQGPGRSATKAEMLRMARVSLDDPADAVDAKIRAYWYPPFSGACMVIGGREFTLVNDLILGQVAADAHQSAELAAGLPAKMKAPHRRRPRKPGP